MAKRIYNLASNKKFIQGRKTRHVVAVILYTVCRMQKTRHLLIDFSDILQTNLYILGSIYLKLIRILNIQVPLIDPSLFIHRFCAKLEFNDKSKLVSSTALKILQSMTRDWMTVGRRPSGLCGAAILISARYHGFKRSTQQIVEVVNVCDETIRKRLEEFSNTPVAKLTKMEFESIQLADEHGMDPPSYSKNRLKDKKSYTEDLSIKAKEIEKIFDDEDVDIEEETEKLIITDEPIHANKEEENNNILLLPQTFIERMKRDDIKFEKDEPLSDIDDKDMNSYISSNEEYKLKKMLWEILFKDWIEDQKDKLPKKPTLKRNRSRKASKSDIIAKDAVEAIKNSDKFKKLNSNIVERLFSRNNNINKYKS